MDVPPLISVPLFRALKVGSLLNPPNVPNEPRASATGYLVMARRLHLGVRRQVVCVQELALEVGFPFTDSYSSRTSFIRVWLAGAFEGITRSPKRMLRSVELFVNVNVLPSTCS